MTDAMGAVAAATASVSRLYGLNSVPASPTYPYGTYSATLGGGDSYTADRREGVRWGEVVVQTFGKTATAALAKYEEARTALVGKSLKVDDYRASTPLEAALRRPSVNRDPNDSGVVTVTDVFTFTATKEA